MRVGALLPETTPQRPRLCRRHQRTAPPHQQQETNGSEENGANLQVFEECHGDSNQVFKVKVLED